MPSPTEGSKIRSLVALGGALAGAVSVGGLAYFLAAVCHYMNAPTLLMLITLSPLAGGYTGDHWPALSLIWAGFNGVTALVLLWVPLSRVAKGTRKADVTLLIHPAVLVLVGWVLLVLLCPIATGPM